MKAKLFCGVLCLLCLLLGAEPIGQTLTTQSSNINARLQNLKAQSLELTALCRTLNEALQKSRTEAATLQTKSTALSENLMRINQELTDCYENITRLEAQLKEETETTRTLGLIFGVLTLIKVVGFVLYSRGIRIPRWLDILI